jgi:hypothetical protein
MRKPQGAPVHEFRAAVYEAITTQDRSSAMESGKLW